jgi:hypothetical protein
VNAENAALAEATQRRWEALPARAPARCLLPEYRPSTAGMRWERLLNDAYRGCTVDPLELAAEMGRYFLIEERFPRPKSGHTEHPVIELLCEVSYAIARSDWPSPWTTEPAAVVAEMILTALNAGGCAVVDVDTDRAGHRSAVVDVLADVVARVPDERSDFAGAQLIVLTLVDAGFALVEVP